MQGLEIPIKLKSLEVFLVSSHATKETEDKTSFTLGEASFKFPIGEATRYKVLGIFIYRLCWLLFLRKLTTLLNVFINFI